MTKCHGQATVQKKMKLCIVAVQIVFKHKANMSTIWIVCEDYNRCGKMVFHVERNEKVKSLSNLAKE